MLLVKRGYQKTERRVSSPAGLKRSASSLGHHQPLHRRNSATSRYAAGGSRSHSPSGSMTARRAGGGSFGAAPDGAVLRSSLVAAEAGGSPKKKMLRRVRAVRKVDCAGTCVGKWDCYYGIALNALRMHVVHARLDSCFTAA